MSDPGAPVSRDAQTLLSTALAATLSGNFDVAEVYCRQTLAAEPGHIDALALLGSVLHHLARYREAEALFMELTERSPDSAVFWTNLGTARRASGKFDPALAAFARAAELGDRTPNFHFNLGLAHLERFDYESARSVLERAVALAPADVEIRIEYARACEALGFVDDAVAALQSCQAAPDITPALMARIARQLSALGEAEAAQRLADRLAAMNPEPRTALTLVQIYERMNRIVDARALLSRIKADPRTISQGVVFGDVESLILQRESRHEEAVTLLGRELARRREANLRHVELFALARSLDALGHHAECFETLQKAHHAQLAHLQLAAPLVSIRTARPLRLADQSIEASDVASWNHTGAPPAEQSPVFIAGLPRSGKALIELMLDAHPQLAMSEGQPLMQAVLAARVAHGAIHPAILGQLDQGELTSAREKYWQAARRRLRLMPGQRLVDSDPMNMLQLPAILRLFPNAPIVFIARHPFDTLLSCYMRCFASAEMAVMSASLATLADCHVRAVDCWLKQSTLPGARVHEVRYEQLVAAPETAARSLAAALQLTWHEAMSRPAEHARGKIQLGADSYADLIRPVDSRSVGRWRPYSARFAGVAATLESCLARWEYSASPG